MFTSKQKIILDRFLAKPCAIFLNVFVRISGKVFNVDHSDEPKRVKVVAIAKFLGLGSIIRSLPMVASLKDRFPQASFILITTLKNKPLVERLTIFNACYYLNDTSLCRLFFDCIVLLPRLWLRKIDLYFDLEVYSAFSTIFATFSLARNRYGFYRDSAMFRFGLNTHLVYFNDHKHISSIYLQLAKACGVRRLIFPQWNSVLKIKDEDVLQLEAWLTSKHIDPREPYIVINANASDLLIERRWPAEYYVLLIDALLKNWHKPILLVGSPQEANYNNSLIASFAHSSEASLLINSAGCISFGMLLALLKKARLMITNDSGLYHLARLLGVQTISLWGPVSPSHYADIHSEKDFVFYNNGIYCSPCLHKTDFPPCRGNNVCMKSISPVSVYRKAAELLGISDDLPLLQQGVITQDFSDLNITIFGA